MGEAGKRRVTEEFSSDAAAKTMIAIYANELAARSERRGRG
jgi:hypothetical protein